MHRPRQTNQQDLSRRTYTLAIAWLFLVLASTTGFNAAMIAGFIAVPLALLAFVSAARKWDGYTRKSIYQRICLMLIGAVLPVSAPVSCSVQSRLLELRLQPVIAALKTYRDSNGSYPGSLDKLVPDHLQSVPSCPNRRIILFTRKEADTAQFSLTCLTFGFNKHDYDSATGSWKDWD
ncbi:hypothetical protein VT98_11714 [Candidatus Electrothrix communis]|uniref:Uncharacterized protein n=1 Tax=Candidatus Electrothrix communis TaxID=1859133 RepID=A0A3S3R222_9BACT|nr:hypothetical protein VT98_11714 [Candidatus Electrothrix communis]